MFRNLLIIVYSLFFTSHFHAQNINLSGTVTDAESGETITGAIVSAPDIPGVGTVTNAYGYFSLSVPKGNQKIKIKL